MVAARYSPGGDVPADLYLIRWTNDNAGPTLSNKVGPLDWSPASPGSFFVVCKNAAAFASAYPGVLCDLEAGSYGPADSDRRRLERATSGAPRHDAWFLT